MNPTSDVFEIIRGAKSLPLDELVLRSSQPPDIVAKEVRTLAADGLVQVYGDLPSSIELAARASGTIVSLTSKGISASTT